MAKQKYWDGTKWVQVAPSMDEFTTHKADNTSHGIGDKATLKTTHKTSIVGAINEAFQSASDGKTAVANAVTAKGVTASPADTFPTLAIKIGQINTGKKWARGTVTSGGANVSFRNQLGSSASSVAVTVTGLPFAPKTIVLYDPYGDVGCAVSIDGMPLRSGGFNTCVTRNGLYRITENAYISSNGFQLPVGTANALHDWIIFE